jgi:tRNA U38,U39,U40 pseudouridine synthase TruA
MEKEEQHQEEENSAKYLSNNTNIQENSYRNFIMQIQSFLDDAGYQEFIKVFKIYRVTKSFDARLQCSGRCYQYVLPLSAVRKVCYFAKTRKHAGFVHYGLINDEEAFKNLCTTDPVLDTTLPAVPFVRFYP